MGTKRLCGEPSVYSMTYEVKGQVWQSRSCWQGREEGCRKALWSKPVVNSPTTSSSTTTAQLPACMRVVFIYEPVLPRRGPCGGLTQDDSSLNVLPFKSSLVVTQCCGDRHWDRRLGSFHRGPLSNTSANTSMGHHPEPYYYLLLWLWRH